MTAYYKMLPCPLQYQNMAQRCSDPWIYIKRYYGWHI